MGWEVGDTEETVLFFVSVNYIPHEKYIETSSGFDPIGHNRA